MLMIDIVSSIRDLNDQEVSIFGILCEELCGYDAIYDILPSGEKQLREEAKLILFLVEQGVQQITKDSHITYLKCGDLQNLQFFHEYLHFDLFGSDENGNNLLHDAVDSDAIDRVKYLLAKGVPNSPNKLGQTPLSIAICNTDIAELIRQYNIPITKRALH